MVKKTFFCKREIKTNISKLDSSIFRFNHADLKICYHRFQISHNTIASSDPQQSATVSHYGSTPVIFSYFSIYGKRQNTKILFDRDEVNFKQKSEELISDHRLFQNFEHKVIKNCGKKRLAAEDLTLERLPRFYNVYLFTRRKS